MSDKFSEGYDLRSSVRIIIQQKAWYITYRDRPSMKKRTCMDMENYGCIAVITP